MNQPRHKERFEPQIDRAELLKTISQMHEVIENMAPSINKASLQIGMAKLKEAAKCA